MVAFRGPLGPGSGSWPLRPAQISLWVWALPSCSLSSLCKPWAVTLGSPRLTPLHSGTGAGPADQGSGQKAMYEVSSECRKGKSVWPRRALASSRSLCDGGPRPTASIMRGLLGPPAGPAPGLRLVGVQLECARWPTGGGIGFLTWLPGTRCLRGVSSLQKPNAELGFP